MILNSSSTEYVCSDLPAAIKESEALRLKQKAWPPMNSGHDSSDRGLAAIMDDEMGFVD